MAFKAKSDTTGTSSEDASTIILAAPVPAEPSALTSWASGSCWFIVKSKVARVVLLFECEFNVLLSQRKMMGADRHARQRHNELCTKLTLPRFKWKLLPAGGVVQCRVFMLPWSCLVLVLALFGSERGDLTTNKTGMDSFSGSQTAKVCSAEHHIIERSQTAK